MVTASEGGIGKPFDPSTKLRVVSLPNHKLRVQSLVEGEAGGIVRPTSSFLLHPSG